LELNVVPEESWVDVRGDVLYEGCDGHGSGTALRLDHDALVTVPKAGSYRLRLYWSRLGAGTLEIPLRPDTIVVRDEGARRLVTIETDFVVDERPK
jgi:hypothetical protein